MAINCKVLGLRSISLAALPVSALLFVHYAFYYSPYDQLLSERIALADCYFKLARNVNGRDGVCSAYAAIHIDLYPEYMAESAADSACLAAKGVLAYIQASYPLQLSLRRRARMRVDRRCNGHS